eukprot:31178-Pelagococcus_subviridis.AAC.21
MGSYGNQSHLGRVFHGHPRSDAVRPSAVPRVADAPQVHRLLRVDHEVQVAHLVVVAPPRAREGVARGGIERARDAYFTPGEQSERRRLGELFEHLRQARVAARAHHGRGMKLKRTIRERFRFKCRHLRPRIRVVTADERLQGDVPTQRVRVDAKGKRDERPRRRVRAPRRRPGNEVDDEPGRRVGRRRLRVIVHASDDIGVELKGVRSGVERRRGVSGLKAGVMGGERRREEKSLRIGVHHADAVVRGPVRGERACASR